MKNYLTPKIQKINMQPHSSNSFENVTPLLSQPSRKNRPQLAAHLHWPVIKEVPPTQPITTPHSITPLDQ